MDIIINREKTFQTFEGFGASGAWWAQDIGGWSRVDENSKIAVKDVISKLLFSKEHGIGLRTYRYNIGSGSKRSGAGEYSDDLRRTDSFDDNGKYDFSRDANAVYMMKQAVRDGADEIVLFANSPIERLTKNHKAHLDKNRAFHTNLARKNYGAFAAYCLDVTEHFVNEGLPVKYLSPINEPLWKWTGGQEGCHYSPGQAGRLMKLFSEELEKREKLKGVKLSGVENGDIRWFNKSYTREFLKHNETKRNIDSVDIHSYFLPAPLPFFNNRPAFLRRFKKFMDKNYPDVPVKMSEWTHMKSGRDRSMNSALDMANVIWEDLTILNVTSWQHWIAVSHYDYCDGLIYAYPESETFEITKRYYVTGNFSKYIPYMAKRVEVLCGDSELKPLAFIKDGKTVLIIINESGNEKAISPPAFSGSGATLVVTNDEYNLREFPLQNGGNIKISPKSVNTILF